MSTTMKIVYGVIIVAIISLVGVVGCNTMARLNNPDLNAFVTEEECNNRFVLLEDSGKKWADLKEWKDDEPNRLEVAINKTMEEQRKSHVKTSCGATH